MLSMSKREFFLHLILSTPTPHMHFPHLRDGSSIVLGVQARNLGRILRPHLSFSSPHLISKSRWLYLEKYPKSDHFLATTLVQAYVVLT